MSLFGVMRTGVSGMTAQSNKLTAVADNIANANTTGYKRASTEFSTMVDEASNEGFAAGVSSHGVTTHVRYAVGGQGNLQHTSSVTDLAVSGDGFFIVSNAAGTPYLTRAGSFLPDSQGNLVNSAGYKLMAYSMAQGAPSVVANGLSGLQPVTLSANSLQPSPSTEGRFAANLPLSATTVASANLPSANASTAAYTNKTSLVSYDNLGTKVTLDVYLTKSGANTWDVAVFDQAKAPAGGGFPYTAAALATKTLTFDATTGRLASSSPTSVDVPIPNGQTLKLDLADMTQLSADYTVTDAAVNGNAPSALDRVEIGNDGTLYSVFKDGSRISSYRIPLAEVRSPDNLAPMPGNVYAPNIQSGDVQVGFPETAGFGSIKSSTLEQSTVDLASELTDMIEAQRGYTANSKVFQTGSDLLDVLVNLKR